MDTILGELAPLADMTGLFGLMVIAWLVITRKLVWHKDLEKVENQRDRWERVALESLGVAGKLTIQGEVTTEVLGKLPDPGASGDAKHRGGAT